MEDSTNKKEKKKKTETFKVLSDPNNVPKFEKNELKQIFGLAQVGLIDLKENPVLMARILLSNNENTDEKKKAEKPPTSLKKKVFNFIATALLFIIFVSAVSYCAYLISNYKL